MQGSFHFFILPVVMFSWSLIYAWKYLQFVPQPADGIHYVWLAKLILTGRFYMEMPDFYENFQSNFVSLHGGKFASIFLPGFSFGNGSVCCSGCSVASQSDTCGGKYISGRKTCF